MSNNNNLNSIVYFVNNEIELSRFIVSKNKFISYPNHIYIETTNACNLRCIMCPRKEMKRKIQMMTFEQFKKIIDNLVLLKIYPRITITGSGEPLLDKTLTNKIQYAKNQGFHISVISNATLLSKERSLKLIKSGLDRIQFSFDSINKITYDKIRIPKIVNKSYFDKTLQNIQGFLKENSKLRKPVYVSIVSVQMAMNKGENTEFNKYWLEKGINNVYLPEVNVRSGKGGLQNKVERRIKSTCVLPFNTLSVMSNGKVSVCGPTKEVNSVGNVLTSSIEVVWFGKMFQMYRKAILKKDMKYLVSRKILCNCCDCWKSGNSFEEYHDLNNIRTKKILQALLSH